MNGGCKPVPGMIIINDLHKTQEHAENNFILMITELYLLVEVPE